ncbi:MAG: hypothetical protein ACODAD_05705 [Planctomycetota bacterium]
MARWYHYSAGLKRTRQRIQCVRDGPSRRPRHANLILSAITLIVTMWAAGCEAEPPRSATTDREAKPGGQTGLPRPVLQAAIDRSAQYLVQACQSDGRFTYRINLDPNIEPEPRYNVLRHAGTIYALAQYCQHAESRRAKEAMIRAAGFLKQRCVGPIADNPNFLGVWSEPDLVGGDQRRQAKLGGTGLGLVALLCVEQVEPGVTSIEELRKLGRFLIFMQKSDGSFYSKFYPDIGRYDLWQSVYYPGEAALGLLMLYQRDPAQRWLHTATKALEDLARRGSRLSSPFPDQWYLLSLQQWFQLAGDQYDSTVQDRLLDHARRLCKSMVEDQKTQQGVVTLHGCFTPDGRTCPSATRLEGLLAALQYLPPEDEPLRRDVRQAIERGLPFLIRSQVTEGPHAGAIPRFTPGFTPPGPRDATNTRLQEVRIDYVQHALSAMIAYEQEFFPQAAPRRPETKGIENAQKP